ncbi:hypothetical protein HK100_003673 [Physocladia obscura]|uniref:AB hydrolase-1 domain-containing protein n=1 Tax=Physocladia obscura TaxID=109957 RepID=A0AAD5SVB1_9FUNG|nr:hypothetical protein HK100_003673 [Physocladia obscura]
MTFQSGLKLLTTITAVAVGAVGAAYLRVVPRSDAALGSLADVTSAEGKALVARFYPRSPDSHIVQTPVGSTYYRLLGPVDGRRVACIHGISGSWASMPQVSESLARRGFRVVEYDLFGRGYSSSPGRKYDAALYVDQLHSLLDHLDWDTTDILGYSLGGGIGVAFANQFPDRVKLLYLVAPSGLMDDIPLAGKLLGVPIIGPVFTYTFGRSILAKRSVANFSPGIETQPHMLHFVGVQMLNIIHNPGFIRAYASSVQYGPIRNMHEIYEKVGKLFGNRICCVWDAKFVPLEGARHSILQEDCEKVLDPISDFFSFHNSIVGAIAVDITPEFDNIRVN